MFIEIAEDAGFEINQIAFVTALADRSQSTYRKVVGTLAWNSFVWFASEPEDIIFLRGKSATFGGKLHEYFSDGKSPELQ